MSKERLEEIQKEVNYAYRRDGSISTKAVTMHIEHYEHLYRQAERVQELEELTQTQGRFILKQNDELDIFDQQNKRYREAIDKFFYNYTNENIDNTQTVIEIVESFRQALGVK